MEPATHDSPRRSRVPGWLRVLIPAVLILLWFGAERAEPDQDEGGGDQDPQPHGDS